MAEKNEAISGLSCYKSDGYGVIPAGRNLGGSLGRRQGYAGSKKLADLQFAAGTGLNLIDGGRLLRRSVLGSDYRQSALTWSSFYAYNAIGKGWQTRMNALHVHIKSTR